MSARSLTESDSDTNTEISHQVISPVLGRILAAETPKVLAAELYQWLQPHFDQEIAIVWSNEWPDDIESHPDKHSFHANLSEISMRAKTELKIKESDGVTVHQHVKGDASLLLGCTLTEVEPFMDVIDLVGLRMHQLLHQEQLEGQVAALAQSERLQRSLFQISEIAASETSFRSIFERLHQVINQLMYSDNLFIVRLTPRNRMVRFLYFVDEANILPARFRQNTTLDDIQFTTTWWVLTEGKPYYGKFSAIRRRVNGRHGVIGVPPETYLGVPMKRGNEVHGAIVVQSYKSSVTYSEKEMNVMSFVAHHLLNALERREAQEELEQQVVLRTQELAQTNKDLMSEVTAREQSERLKDALFRISSLTSSNTTGFEMFQQLHQLIATLVPAKSIYFAFLNRDTNHTEFPYYINEKGENKPFTRLRTKGLTERVIDTEKTITLDRTRFERLIQMGAIDRVADNSNTVSWLGVPMRVGDEVIGMIGVQTHEGTEIYSEEDAELMEFMAQQVGQTIQHRRANDLLKHNHEVLEQRVQERTQALESEVEERRRYEEELRYQLTHDALTGMPNRRAIRTKISRSLHKVRSELWDSITLINFDIDQFRLFNETLGYVGGDLLLKIIGKRLQRRLPDDYFTAHLSADEFAILIAPGLSEAATTSLINDLIQDISQPITIKGREVQLSMHFGVANANSKHENADDFLRDAGMALSKCKMSRTKRIVFFDQKLHEAKQDALKVQEDIRNSIKNNEFHAFLQPIVRLNDQTIVGYETLARWQHPERGLLTPGSFLDIARTAGLLNAIDTQVIKNSCQQANKILQDNMFLTINVSPSHLHPSGLVSMLPSLLREHNIGPNQLCIEVTEDVLLSEPEMVSRMLYALRDLGVDAAVDDFGSGYSSLGYLYQFPLKLLKIDRSFVSPLGTDDSWRVTAVVEAVLALGRALNLTVIAEGIETQQQLDKLIELGCPLGQGYLLGRPHSADYWQEVQNSQRSLNLQLGVH